MPRRSFVVLFFFLAFRMPRAFVSLSSLPPPVCIATWTGSALFLSSFSSSFFFSSSPLKNRPISISLPFISVFFVASLFRISPSLASQKVPANCQVFSCVWRHSLRRLLTLSRRRPCEERELFLFLRTTSALSLCLWIELPHRFPKRNLFLFDFQWGSTLCLCRIW